MTEEKKRILTGHRPTGARHIGHLVGTLFNWVKLQETHECIFLVADLHVLTTDYQHPDQILANSREIVTDWLAVGIDPQKSTLALQSAIPEHVQLCLLLSMLVTDARLHRVPTFKEQVQNLNLDPSLGLLTYPVLQAADILLYHAEYVPVGEDQLPHLELTRELARRFNNLYGEYFPEPEAILSRSPRLPGIDNRTMHTSYGNQIFIKDTPEETTRKVMSMYTDPTRIHATDPGHVEGNPVFAYLDEFDPDVEQVDELKERYRAGKVGDVAVKRYLSEVLNKSLDPIRQRRIEIAGDTETIEAVLREGTRHAHRIAEETLRAAMDRMGLRLHVSLGRENNADDAELRGAFC